MKILFVCSKNSVFSKNANPFVKSLVDGMRAKGCYVDCDLDNFWTNYQKYDIIFLQWPEEIYRWNRSKINLDALSGHFNLLKKIRRL